MRPNCPDWPNAAKGRGETEDADVRFVAHVLQRERRIGEHGARGVAVSGDYEVETDRRVAVCARLEILRMERRAQRAGEHACGGVTSRIIRFQLNGVLTNVCRCVLRENVTRSWRDAMSRCNREPGVRSGPLPDGGRSLRLPPRSRFPFLRGPAPRWGTVLDTIFRCAQESHRRGRGRDA